METHDPWKKQWGLDHLPAGVIMKTLPTDILKY